MSYKTHSGLTESSIFLHLVSVKWWERQPALQDEIHPRANSRRQSPLRLTVSWKDRHTLVFMGRLWSENSDFYHRLRIFIFCCCVCSREPWSEREWHEIQNYHRVYSLESWSQANSLTEGSSAWFYPQEQQMSPCGCFSGQYWETLLE